MSEYMRIGEAAKLLRVSPITLRDYANKGLIDYETTPFGHRVFTKEGINKFKGVATSPTKTYAFYVRSSKNVQRYVELQEEKLVSAYGPPHKIYSDKASGLSEKRKGLQRMLKAAKKGEFDTLAITSKDRLTRFGFTYLEILLKEYGVTIEFIDDLKQKEPHEELLEDFMALLASFSGKFYKLRGLEQRRKLLERAEEELNADS